MNLLSTLRDLIDNHYSDDELSYLAFDLSIEYENIGGKNTPKKRKVQELVQYCCRHELLDDLIQRLEQEHPRVNWRPQPLPTVVDGIEQVLTTQQKIHTISTKPGDFEDKLHEERFEEDLVHQKRLLQEPTRASFVESSTTTVEIPTLIEEADLADKSEQYERAANLYKHLAVLLKQEKRYVLSKTYARKAARCFLKINRKEAAIEQHLFAAEIWMNHTAFASTMADHDLEEAKKILAEVVNFALLAKTCLLQAQYSMLLGFRREIERMWEQVEALLPKVHSDFQLEIATELALQKSMIARLEGEWELAERVLNEANSRDWPLRFGKKRLELLWCLLFLHSELGNWEEVDRIYEQARNLIDDQDEGRNAKWLMHYAAALARKGEADRAFEMYMSALAYFKSINATPSEKHHFFQDMIYSLINTKDDVFSSAMRYDTERLDLALSALHEDIGYLHKERARATYLEGKIDRAFAHAEYSFLYGWRKGDWSGLSEAHHTLAFLYGAEQDYIQATFAAISSGQNKTVEQYASRLNDLFDPEEIEQVMEHLLQKWGTPTGQQLALVALAKCIEIVPSNRLDDIIQLATHCLKQYLVTPSNTNSNVCRSAIKVLNLLAPRFSETQTNEMILLGIETVDEEIHWTNKLELIKLIGACFTNGCTPQTNLYLSAVEAILPYFDRGALQAEAEFSLLDIGINAPIDARKIIIDFFYSRSNWDFLAILKEIIPDETVRQHIENTFHALEPEKGSVSIGGRGVRSINNFNEYIFPSMTDMVVDGLIAVIRNPDSILHHKAQAILTIRWLPDEVLAKRANEIGQWLLQVANNRQPSKEVGGLERLFGNEEDVRRNSLYALGHLYAFVNSNLKMQIRKIMVLLSTNNFPAIRMGSAMALRLVEDPSSFSPELTYTLVELMHDKDSDVRHWATSAAGHRIADGSLSKNASLFILERLIKAATDDKNAHARAGAAYGLKILATSDTVSDSVKKKIEEARQKTLQDVNFEVVRMATKSKAITKE